MISKWPERWQGVLSQYRRLVAAAGFLSILSLPGSKRLFARATGDTPLLIGGEYFPLVGLLLALVMVGVSLVLGPLVPRLVLAALLVVVLVVLTGGLHLDGLMDSCDGLFGGRTVERKLEIMRDSRVGSFGVLAGICSLLLKFACLASLDIHSLSAVLCVTLPVARWTLVLVLHFFPGARPDGLGAIFRRDMTSRRLALAYLLTLAIALVGAQLVGLLVWCVVTLTALAMGAWITRKLGGLTGDTCGAIAEVAEVTGLLLFILLHF